MRNWLAEAKRIHRRFGGKRTIKDKCKGGVPRGRKEDVSTLGHWPAATSRYVVVGEVGRR